MNASTIVAEVFARAVCQVWGRAAFLEPSVEPLRYWNACAIALTLLRWLSKNTTHLKLATPKLILSY